MKDILWLGDSLKVVKGFPAKARKMAGDNLFFLQLGDDPTDWKPMPSIGQSVREIRIKVGEQFRIMYLATRPEGIYVLHAFQKKSAKTSQRDIELAKNRFRGLIERGKGKE